MGTKNQAGFTIIETMLFLGISGFLVVAMIAGTGTSLNIQRYRDSVETFKSVLQQQYADLASVVNSRSDDWTCTSTALPSDSMATKDLRGQSNCIVLGKYVRIENRDMSIYTVIGHPTSTTVQPNDVATLKNNYIMNVSTAEVVERQLEWGTFISWPKVINGSVNPNPLTPRKLGILIVRSPDTGQVYTFTNSDGDVPDTTVFSGAQGPVALSNMLVAGDTVPGQGEQLICISTNGLFINQDRAVYLGKYAAGASAVEVRSNEYLLANGGSEC